ncbi:hypothetical protein DUNSADRAFT_14360 [Dunaliella salina]|uniref:Encoded protein n=1 Tax=Dunaliella salina TaxID=3046 RepID=A0ABQ7G7H2_DUNSA|nr:hypothetical protein DUNSADRAFT_14360 [Dunaliella salina]|eukprot:KAF5830553.1 hypothetical protein DUNSADRAFT_14360 [Dunaliella salina]
MDVAFDWRIRVQPPLVLQNTLPVGAQYVVWERPSAGGSISVGTGSGGSGRLGSSGGGVLRACAWGRMSAWGSAHVYTADMRQQVYLSFWPDGCAFAEAEPVLISEGCIGSRGTPGVSSDFVGNNTPN